MPSPTPQPSSLTSGFFQSLPIVPPQYSAPPTSVVSQGSITDDPILNRLIALYLPSPVPAHIPTHLHDFARLVLHPSTLTHTVDADTNLPTLHPLTTFGTPNLTDPLHTSTGWRELKRIETANGVIGHGYPRQTTSSNSVPYNLRIHQFLTLHLWGGSSAVSTCPMAMTDGAAVLLRQQLTSPDLSSSTRKVLSSAYERLISIDPSFAWTSGQWMTERSGGSDVRGTETFARKLTSQELSDDQRSARDKDSIGNDLGDWRIDGFKWFSSATDADCVVLLAQTSRGLSAFFAPMRRRVALLAANGGAAAVVSADGKEDVAFATEMNGVYISRLKNKLGTKAVPTAELEIRGMRAYLLGDEGQGVKIISSVLNITRLWTANGGVAGWARGLAISRAFTRARKVKGGMGLSSNKQHVKWMADETVNYRAMTALYMFGVALLGHTENPQGCKRTKAWELGLLPASKEATEKLLRLLTPLMKSSCSLRSVEGLRACMESLGGVGYCENNEDNGILNIARLFRDANVNPIWEGTGSVLAEDLLRALRVGRPGAKEELDGVFGVWFERVTAALGSMDVAFGAMIAVVKRRYGRLKTILASKTEEELLWQGRLIATQFEAVICAVLLMADAAVDGDETASAVAERWVRMKVKDGAHESELDWQKEVEMDRRIFRGDHEPAAQLVPKL